MAKSTAVYEQDSIAVVIVNYNGEKYIENCLTALQHQTVSADRILVVDNASSDASPQLITKYFPEVELVCLENNTGFAGGNNHAFSLIKNCEWVALLNPDTVASDTWIEQLKKATRDHPKTDVFSCRLENLEQPGTLDGTGDQYHVSGLGWRRDHGLSTKILRQAEESVFAPCAAAALYHLPAVREVGGFDEEYFCYNEDTDLVFRMRLRGGQCLHLDDVVVQHAGSGITGRQSDFSLYHGHRNLVWTYFKNMPAQLFWLYLPQHILLNLVTVIYFGCKGRLRVISRAKWHALLGLPRVLGMRKEIQKNRKVACSELSKFMITNPLAAYFNRYAH